MSGHVQGRLSAYRDGELSVVEATEVRHHVESCEACADRLRVLEDVDQAVRGAFVPAGPREGFAARVRAGIEASSARRKPRSVLLWPWMAAAAAVLLIGVVVPRLTLRAVPEAAPSPTLAVAPAASPAPVPPPTSLALSPEAQDKLRGLGYGASAPQPPAALPLAERSSREDASGRLTLRDAKPDEVAKSEYAPPATTVPGPQESTVRRAREPREADAFAAPPPPAPARDAPRAVPPAVPEAHRDQAETQQEAARDDELGVKTMTTPEAADAASADTRVAGAAAPAGEAFAGPRAGANRQELKRKAEPRPRAATEELSEYAGLVGRQALSLAEARALRESWRRYVERYPQGPHSDEARVQVVAMGGAAVRHGGGTDDGAVARKDARAYLAREDAAQKERVRTMLVEIGPE